jgi:hypothetical protein
MIERCCIVNSHRKCHCSPDWMQPTVPVCNAYGCMWIACADGVSKHNNNECEITTKSSESCYSFASYDWPYSGCVPFQTFPLCPCSQPWSGRQCMFDPSSGIYKYERVRPGDRITLPFSRTIWSIEILTSDRLFRVLRFGFKSTSLKSNFTPSSTLVILANQSSWWEPMSVMKDVKIWDRSATAMTPSELLIERAQVEKSGDWLHVCFQLVTLVVHQHRLWSRIQTSGKGHTISTSVWVKAAGRQSFDIFFSGGLSDLFVIILEAFESNVWNPFSYSDNSLSCKNHNPVILTFFVTVIISPLSILSRFIRQSVAFHKALTLFLLLMTCNADTESLKSSQSIPRNHMTFFKRLHDWDGNRSF